MDDIQPVKQILSKFALFYLIFQISVGCGNYPYINSNGLLSTNSLKFPFCKDP